MDQSVPSAALMDRLSALRLTPFGARATVGLGERASQSRGAGMEFTDFRSYRAGDDLRHVDPRSLARGEPYTREYIQHRQLMVTIVLDLTPSMTTGAGNKAKLATGLARALGFLGLTGQDRLRLVVLEEGGTIRHSPLWQGRSRAAEMFDFATPRKASRGSGDAGVSNPMASVITSLLPTADAGSVIFLLSDLWENDIVTALTALGHRPAMVVAMHILAAEERDPASIGRGVFRLADAESAEERDVTLDEETLARYHEALGRHQDQLSDAMSGGRHLFLPVKADDQLADICLEQLPALGVIA